jgi:muramoyltetrapeptide carboxypeptidase LdcA involved in peptidoglycan recycling
MLGIFALSAALKDTDLEKYSAGLDLLISEKIDFKKANNLELKDEIFPDADYFTAGSVNERIAAFHDLKAKFLLSLKGGYGVQQCLSELKISDFKSRSLFAYSDLTALFLKLQKDRSIKLFHSPMLVELSSLSLEEFLSFKSFLLEEKHNDFKTKLLALTTGLVDTLKASDSCFLNSPSYVWGGNLTLILSSCVKPVIDKGYKKILFIEDCYEEAYKVERMLYSAANQNLFDNIDELWLGESKEAFFNIDLLNEFASEYNFNLVLGLPFGHNKKFTLPIFHYYD